MKKRISLPAFSSPLSRFTAYTIALAIGSSLYEMVRPAIPYGFLIPSFTLIALFVLTGLFLIHDRNIISRVTSAAVLLILSVMAVGFGTGVPGAYTLLLAVGISLFGAQSLFHRHQSSMLKTAGYIGCAVTISVIFCIVFLYFSALLLRTATTPGAL